MKKMQREQKRSPKKSTGLVKKKKSQAGTILPIYQEIDEIVSDERISPVNASVEIPERNVLEESKEEVIETGRSNQSNQQMVKKNISSRQSSVKKSPI
jgi:hypothetical protein